MLLFDRPHRRLNLLTNEWVLVSPQRTLRPWLGQIEKQLPDQRPVYDPTCYLCPGNERAGGKRNPAYTDTFVFDNDFAALLPTTPSAELKGEGLLVAVSERGACRVVCFSPRHDLTLPEMAHKDIRRIVQVWADQTQELGSRSDIRYVQVFENQGAMMGASNPHPHCQIWASEHIPTEPEKELRSMQAYQGARGGCLLCDYLRVELKDGARVVLECPHWVALVPFWAVWPFEVMLLPRRHVDSISSLHPAEQNDLAAAIRRLTTRYDNLFEVSFPYSMGFHQSPTDGASHPEMHLHAHYYPPLLRSATVRKFMVGYEMLGNPQRDITPEAAAARLRDMRDALYRQR